MPEANITISVIIPAYNAARFLPRCLGSVFAQTLKPTEVIVVDDGSTDDTAATAASLGATVIRRSNVGVSAARNLGIGEAKGEWIALLDADDLWAPTKLERQASLIRDDTVLIYTGVRSFDDHGNRGEQPALDPLSARKILRHCNPITTSSVLVRREALKREGGFREDIRTCEDWEMWMRLKPLGEFAAIADPLTDYYLYPQSLSANPERMLEALERILDRTLLADLRSPYRWMWRQRIRATQLASAGLIARDNKLKGELRYMLRSYCVWPSPFWEPKRLAMLAVSARNSLRRRKGTG